VAPSRRRPPCGRAAESRSHRPALGRSPSQPRPPDRHDAAARPAPSGGQPDSAGAGRRPSASVPQGPGCAVGWSVCGSAALEWVGCSGQAASRSMRRGRNGISRRRPAFWRAGRCGTVCSRRRHSPPHERPFGTGSGCCRRRPPAHPVPSPAQRCGNGHRADLVNLDTGATVYENAAPSQCPEGGLMASPVAESSRQLIVDTQQALASSRLAVATLRARLRHTTPVLQPARQATRPDRSWSTRGWSSKPSSTA